MSAIPHVDFWDNVVTNAAAIIASLTAMIATLGGIWIQYRSTKKQFQHQNEKIEQNATAAQIDRRDIAARVQDVHDAANGIAQRNEQMARVLGVAEGRAQQKAESPPP